MSKIAAISLVVALVNVSPAFAGPAPLKLSLTPAALRAALPPTATQQPTAANTKRSAHPVRNLALIGAAAGMTIGFIGMKSGTDNCPAGRSCSTAGAGVFFYGALGAGLGALAGWLASK